MATAHISMMNQYFHNFPCSVQRFILCPMLYAKKYVKMIVINAKNMSSGSRRLCYFLLKIKK